MLLDLSSDLPSPFPGRTHTSGSWVTDMSFVPDSSRLCVCAGQTCPLGEWLQCSCERVAVPSAHRCLIVVQSREVFTCSRTQHQRSIRKVDALEAPPPPLRVHLFAPGLRSSSVGTGCILLALSPSPLGAALPSPAALCTQDCGSQAPRRASKRASR